MAYSRELKQKTMTALLVGDRSMDEMSKETGIPKGTLKDWKEAAKAAHPADPPASVAKRDVIELLDAARRAYLDRTLSAEAVQSTSGYYAAAAVKIFNEQHQLLTGGATSRAEVSLEDLFRREAGEVVDLKTRKRTA